MQDDQQNLSIFNINLEIQTSNIHCKVINSKFSALPTQAFTLRHFCDFVLNSTYVQQIY